MRYPLMLACVAAATLTSACTSRQAYDSGQAWQRNECQRCMGSASTSYDSYQRQRQDIQK